MKKVSVILRSKNEERWIRHCIKSIKIQSFKDIEIILVDNYSTDRTIDIAKSEGVDKVLMISEFKPGRALNMGCEIAEGDILIFLSAHCIPKDENWISNLISPLLEYENVVGSYGRQLPLAYTMPADARDLLITFGRDFKVQTNEIFFHNANSAILKSIWKAHPFDDQVPNIEDRLWAKDVVSQGFRLAYTPYAPVYHFHGLHHGNKMERLKGVINLMTTIEKLNSDFIPDQLMPSNLCSVAIIPVSIPDKLNSQSEVLGAIQNLVEDLRSSKLVRQIFLVSEEAVYSGKDVFWIDRRLIEDNKSISVELLLKKVLDIIELEYFIPDLVIYANYEYVNRPKNYFKSILEGIVISGSDTYFPAKIDFGHYWKADENGEYQPILSTIVSKEQRNPIYKAFYGIGTVVYPSVIRQGTLFGNKVGAFLLEGECNIERKIFS